MRVTLDDLPDRSVVAVAEGLQRSLPNAPGQDWRRRTHSARNG